MNYWPAEVANLAECHTALFDFIRNLSVNGAKTARINYGCRGWCSHHNADLWCQSAPVGNYGGGQPQWANFPLSGAWLCHHLWEHYAFGGDLAWLRDFAWPIMRGAAEFCLDWLIEDRASGRMPRLSGDEPLHLGRERLRHARPASRRRSAWRRRLT